MAKSRLGERKGGRSGLGAEMKGPRIIGFPDGKELRYMYRAETTKRIVPFVDFATE